MTKRVELVKYIRAKSFRTFSVIIMILAVPIATWR